MNDEEGGFYIFLTVNALISTSIFGRPKSRNIELNWTLPPDAQRGDWVGLFRLNPDFRLTGRASILRN